MALCWVVQLLLFLQPTTTRSNEEGWVSRAASSSLLGLLSGSADRSWASLRLFLQDRNHKAKNPALQPLPSLLSLQEKSSLVKARQCAGSTKAATQATATASCSMCPA